MKRLILLSLILGLGIGAAAQDCVQFQNRHIFDRALKAGDTDENGILSPEEAAAIAVLDLESTRSDLFVVDSYADLALLPGLKKLSLGETRLKTVDLSRNPGLEEIYIGCEAVKTLILAKGCQPKLVMKSEWMGDTLPEPEIVYSEE